MTSLTNIRLMTYLILVAIVGTLGNGVILFAYGNRWSSSKSTSVVFILILACVDLWTCLIAVPTIAIMEYREFDVPTFICRFYTFSKNLIIISSFIMSLIALDRFLNIALPHYRLLNPRRVKVLLTLFITIGTGLGVLTALAFSTQPYRNLFIARYDLVLADSPYIQLENSNEIWLDYDHNSSLNSSETYRAVAEQIPMPDGANLSNLSLDYRLTTERCFADTTIISDVVRDVLKHISNKFFFVSIGIVTIFYSITFVLALQRQNPRIKALKKSINVLNKFDPHSSHQRISRPVDSSISLHTITTVFPSATASNPTTTTRVSTATKSDSTRTTAIYLDNIRHSNGNFSDEDCQRKSLTNQQYEMSQLIINDDIDDQTLPSIHLIQQEKEVQAEHEPHISVSDETSDDLQPCTEKINGTKQVSFQIEHGRTTLNQQQNQQLSVSSENGLDIPEEIYYKLPYPCSTTRQLLIKFHFTRPSSICNRWFCCCCYLCALRGKRRSKAKKNKPIVSPIEDETTTILPSHVSNHYTSVSHSETLKRQLHQHRLKQLRMASTFLLITVSFVLFYLPSILNAERIIKSPMTIYYLYLCTHALNPLIYCFMNPSLRAYVLSMFKCRSRQIKWNSNSKSKTTVAAASFFER